MKNNRIFPGMIFIGGGLYYLAYAFAPQFANEWMTWETLLVWLGVALAFEGFFTKSGAAVLPGIFIIGLGIHFHAVTIYPNWPNDVGVIATLLGIACLITYLFARKDTLLLGVLLICLGALFLFFEPVVANIAEATETITFIWPILLLVIGGLLLFRRKNKRFKRR
ncbi:hypothetical protein [Natribacillus halophilus]|uniref:DUF5668 domain-containing protein n=1 Tax=Natribacillus halophilus TaxID=549003 RepID=A0A1G8LT04_9BACI|nr:hypothetical protein [Natribacillus halophilus]SDI58617.1 hypothetical protein SAMN04488123_103251 [Natribacillus halophilus]